MGVEGWSGGGVEGVEGWGVEGVEGGGVKGPSSPGRDQNWSVLLYNVCP